MRKLILLWISTILAGNILQAQVTEGGNFIIGSTVGFSTANSKVTQTEGTGTVKEQNPFSTQIAIAPNIGYFLLDNLALGIRMDYTFSNVRDQNNNSAENSNVLFGPFMRYYLPMSQANDFFIFGEAGFGFGNSRDLKELATGTQRINTNLFAFGVGPGVTVIASNAVGLEAVMKYNFARSEFDTQIGGVNANTTTRTNQVSVSLGLQFYFSGLKRANR